MKAAVSAVVPPREPMPAGDQTRAVDQTVPAGDQTRAVDQTVPAGDPSPAGEYASSDDAPHAPRPDGAPTGGAGPVGPSNASERLAFEPAGSVPPAVFGQPGHFDAADGDPTRPAPRPTGRPAVAMGRPTAVRDQAVDRQPGRAGSDRLPGRPDGAASSGEAPGCTPAQLRRFIKSRAWIPMHELRRRFSIDGHEDDVLPVRSPDGRVFVGLPEREAQMIGDLFRSGDVGFELSHDPESPIVIGVYPMRPVTRG